MLATSEKISRASESARRRSASSGEPLNCLVTIRFPVKVEQCYVNIGTALAAVGGTFDDLAKLTVYVVDWTPEKMPLFLEGVSRAAARLGTTPVPPGTLVGVAALDTPEHLVEVEATAVLDA